MKVKQLSLGPLGTNCYIIEEGDDLLIIDPGAEAEKLIQHIDSNQKTPVAILLTHAHFDHIGAVDKIREYYQISVYIHEEEKDWLIDPTLNGSSHFAMVTPPIQGKEADHYIKLGEMSIGPFSFEVRYTPGHSPGSVSFVFYHDQFVIAGDTLFQGGIGRTDLPGGDMETLMNSIHQELFSLNNNFKVCPGHGPITSIEAEKESNPFL